MYNKRIPFICFHIFLSVLLFGFKRQPDTPWLLSGSDVNSTLVLIDDCKERFCCQFYSSFFLECGTGSLSLNYIELILNCERTPFLTALLAGIKSRNQKAIIHSDLIIENYQVDQMVVLFSINLLLKRTTVMVPLHAHMPNSH